VARDYTALAAFHYVGPRPATWADVWVVRYQPHCPACRGGIGPPQPVAVAVLSYPVPSCHGREDYLRRRRFSRAQNLRFANRHVRTISRVIVHPQFRSLGLSSLLVRCLCTHCDTRYVEAIAQMAAAHPLFRRGGLRRVRTAKGKPMYFIRDRWSRKTRRTRHA
jgi:hypothetical protein